MARSAVKKKTARRRTGKHPVPPPVALKLEVGYLTVEELAPVLRITKWTLYDLMAKGDGPPGRKVGRTWRFDPAGVRDWLRQPKAKP